MQFGRRAGVHAHQRFRDAQDVEEQKLLRIREQLLQQRIAAERAPRIRQHHLIGLEADRTHRARRKDLRRSSGLIRIANRDAETAVGEQLINRVSDCRLAAEMNPQWPQALHGGSGRRAHAARRLERSKARAAQGRQRHFDRANHFADARSDSDLIACRPGRAVDLGGPQRRIEARAKTKRDFLSALEQAGAKLGASLDEVAAGQFSALTIHLELHHHERRQRSHVLRIENVEQRLGDLWQIVGDAQLQPSGEEREAFEQALDVRIFAASRLELQPPRDLRISLGELGAQASQIGQLALVVEAKIVRGRASFGRRHRRESASASRTSYTPLPVWSTVSKFTSSVPTSRQRTASIEKRTPKIGPSSAVSYTRTFISLGSWRSIASANADLRRSRPAGVLTATPDTSGSPNVKTESRNSSKRSGTSTIVRRVLSSISRSRFTLWMYRALSVSNVRIGCEPLLGLRRTSSSSCVSRSRSDGMIAPSSSIRAVSESRRAMGRLNRSTRAARCAAPSPAADRAGRYADTARCDRSCCCPSRDPSPGTGAPLGER